MAYNLNKTNGDLLVTVLDGTITGTTVNDRYSLVFIGKNYPSYGSIEQRNFLKLLENGAENTSPLDRGIIPLAGELWYDTSINKLKIYDGIQFKLIGTATGTAAPINPGPGDTWWDTNTDQLKAYSGTTWLIVGPAYGKNDGLTGPIVESVYDGTNKHTVISEFTGNVRTAIISQDSEFTPNVVIPGYPSIKPGLNVNFGNGNGFVITQNVNTTEIINNKSTGNIALRANIGGTITTVLQANGATGLITVLGNPTNNLGVATKSYVDTAVGVTNSYLITNVAAIYSNISGLVNNAATQATNINSLELLKATVLSPALTGTPTAPTPTVGTTSTQIATTAFVATAVSTANTALKSYSETYAFNAADAIDTKLKSNVNTINANIGTVIANTGGLASSINSLTITKASIASPTFTGAPQSVTAPSTSSNTMIATTAFVKTSIQGATDALWKGSNKYVSASAPTSGDGANGDIWFQI
jgi:hypothetical protein